MVTKPVWLGKKPGYPDSIEGVFEAIPVYCEPTTIKNNIRYRAGVQNNPAPY